MLREALRSHKVSEQNWQFLLISSVLRGVWFVKPEIALSQGKAVEKLINRDWSGFDQASDLQKMERRAVFPVVVIDDKGRFVAQTSKQMSASSMFDKAPGGSTAIVPIKGTMLKYGTMCTYGTEEIAAYLLDAASHKNISSIILDIDSGGGAVDSVAPISQAILKAKNTYGKPVVASVDLCCSAAYWAASNCSAIVANNDVSAEIGSIGVMATFTDVKPMWEKEGVVFHTVYADQSEYKNRPFQKALKGEYDEIKTEELNPLAIRFQDEVKRNRGNKLVEETKGILAGRTFFAQTAKEIGLIDEVGTVETAVEIARELVDQANIQEYLKS